MTTWWVKVRCRFPENPEAETVYIEGPSKGETGDDALAEAVRQVEESKRIYEVDHTHILSVIEGVSAVEMQR